MRFFLNSQCHTAPILTPRGPTHLHDVREVAALDGFGRRPADRHLGVAIGSVNTLCDHSCEAKVRHLCTYNAMDFSALRQTLVDTRMLDIDVWESHTQKDSPKKLSQQKIARKNLVIPARVRRSNQTKHQQNPCTETYNAGAQATTFSRCRHPDCLARRMHKRRRMDPRTTNNRIAVYGGTLH